MAKYLENWERHTASLGHTNGQEGLGYRTSCGKAPANNTSGSLGAH